MKALIFVEYPEMSVVKDALQRQFVDFEIIVLKPSENTLYSEANTLVKIVSDNEGVPVFVFISQPLFLAIVSAKLSRILKTFQVLSWERESQRFRVLKVP